MIGGVLTLPAFIKTYGLSGISKTALANLTANIVSTLQAGCFFGALLASPLADRLGRRMALLISAVIVTIGCVFQAAGSGKLAVMYIGRLVAGFGVGAASMITPLYCSENAPRAIRGGLTGLYQLFIATGTMLAFWLNYGASYPDPLHPFTDQNAGSLLHLKGNTTYSKSTHVTDQSLRQQLTVAVQLCLSAAKPSLQSFSSSACSSVMKVLDGSLEQIAGKTLTRPWLVSVSFPKTTHTFKENSLRCPSNSSMNAC